MKLFYLAGDDLDMAGVGGLEAVYWVGGLAFGGVFHGSARLLAYGQAVAVDRF